VEELTTLCSDSLFSVTASTFQPIPTVLPVSSLQPID
jgi:hypothetical protein